MKRSLTLSIFLVLNYFLLANCQDLPKEAETQAKYQSPYWMEYTFPLEDLIGDILSGRRGDSKEESSIPFNRWDSSFVRERYGVWGPPSKEYPPPPGLDAKDIEWKRERVIAVALRFDGYPYQHHHIPDWQPPESWPWKPVAEGRDTKGLDCSNFTSFVYNLAFGLIISSDIKKQSERLRVGLEQGYLDARRIERPQSYDAFKSELKTGDLLFIDSKGEISHVVIWVGKIGHSPDGTPLVLDSTGSHHKDCNGVLIPNGIHLRPFTEDSWYFKSMDHAMRILHEE